MTFEITFVLLALLGMVVALVLDKMRPGMVLFSVVVVFLCAGILTPKEMLEAERSVTREYLRESL